MFLKKIMATLTIVWVCCFLMSCAEITAGKAAISYATEDRSFDVSIRDTQNQLSLKSDLFQANHTYPVELVLLVSEGRVLVAGYVNSQQEIDDILEIIWKNPYVSKVYNHLWAKPSVCLVETSKDIYLDKKIATDLVFQKGITSANYKTAVYDKVAYVIGSSVSMEEKKMTLETIKKVSGLRDVIAYITIISK